MQLIHKTRTMRSLATVAFGVLISFSFLVLFEVYSPSTSYAQHESVRAEDHKKSLKHYEKGLKLYNEGLELYKKSEWENANKKFEQAVTLLKEENRYLKKANFYQGYCYYLLGDYTKSRDYFDRGKPYRSKQLKEEGISPRIISFAISERITDEEYEKKSWYKKWYWWALIVTVVGGIVGGVVAGSNGGGGGSETLVPGGGNGEDTGDVTVSW